MKIHTIGDSHSYAGWHLVGATVHHLGPLLCYSFGRDSGIGKRISNFGIVAGDTVVFCLGEIDCRCHIHKHVSPELSYQTIIDGILAKYLAAIQSDVSILNTPLKHVCVYNVVPPINRRNTEENKEFPFLGTDEERKSYVKYFNSKLREKCAEYGYVFFDVYDKYADEHGFLRKDLSDKNVHILDGIYLREFITKNLY